MLAPVLLLPASVVELRPFPEPRCLHVCAGGDDSAVTHGHPARAGSVPRGEPPCQDQPRGRTEG